MLEIGDKVRYVPDTCHALVPDHKTGTFPFKMGVKRMDPVSKEETVTEVSHDKLAAKLASMRRSPKGRADRDKLVLMSPLVTWPAYVTAVNDDGTVDLHIKHKGEDNDNAMDCPSVKIDLTGKTPHTCRP